MGRFSGVSGALRAYARCRVAAACATCRRCLSELYRGVGHPVAGGSSGRPWITHARLDIGLSQNQHLDVYGVLYAPELYRLGTYTNDENLQSLARVMYRSCGQLIDPWGRQGEQIQQTNFAQRGDLSDVTQFRGGYAEGWTVFWITAHFLHAAAKFDEMGVRP